MKKRKNKMLAWFDKTKNQMLIVGIMLGIATLLSNSSVCGFMLGVVAGMWSREK